MTNPTAELAPNALTQRRFSQIIIATVVVGFFLLAGMATTTGLLLARARDFGDLVQHTYEVETRIADVRALFERTEAARRAYLIDPAARYQRTYDDSAPRLQPLLAELRQMTLDNPEQTARLDRLQPLVTEKLDLLEQTMALRRQGDLNGAMTAFSDDREQVLLDAIRLATAEMGVAERELLRQRTEAQNTNARTLFVAASAAGVMLGVLAIISLWVMLRFARDLTRSQGQLRTLNEGLESAVRDRTADLTRANEEIQRFAYIVSHDLRSPLVNIMGFTSELEVAAKPLRKLIDDVETAAPQLLTREAKEAVVTDLPESIGFIRSSTRKMDGLINAILKLSREGRRSLNPERLETRALVDGVVGSLRFMAEQAGAEVEVEGDLPDLVSDRVAIEQLFSNLVENALKYLKPGRPGVVRIRGRTDGARVVFEVEDNGRGIAPRDHERIFDLFRRAGAQDQPGEGIGLAHVRALAYRLGGLISCTSELDQGATFRLSLPRVLAISVESSG